MERAATIAEFVKAPRGRYFIGRTHLVWCRRADLIGTTFWGRPSGEDADALFETWKFDRGLPGPFDLVSDLGRVESIDPVPFAKMLQHVLGRRDELDGKIRKHAFVRPPGLTGAIVAGFNHVLSSQHTWFVGDTTLQAFQWIDHPDGEATRLEITRLVEHASTEAHFVSQIRARLRSHPQHTIDRVAAELAMSRRSLQRRLAAGGTSFRAVVDAARIETACELLQSTDDKLSEIARQLGLASERQLGRLFHQAGLGTPIAYRERSRRG